MFTLFLSVKRLINVCIGAALTCTLSLHAGVSDDSIHAAEFDFIIIGSGCAGTVLASRLSENPNARVCVISAGTYFPATTLPVAPFTTSVVDEDTRQSKLLANTPFTYSQPIRSFTWNVSGLLPRIFTKTVLGGGSTGNSRGYTWGDPATYEFWEDKLGLPGWNFDALIPHFKAVETVFDFEPDPATGGQTSRPVLTTDPNRGTNGPLVIYRDNVNTNAPEMPLRVVGFECPLPGGTLANNYAEVYDPNSCIFPHVFKSNALDFWDGNGRDVIPNRYFIFQFNQNTAVNGFLDKPNAWARPNLTILQGQLADFVLVDKCKNGECRATGVQLNSGQILKARLAVIVSAGAEGSPKVLLQSGIGPKAELEALGIKCRCDLPGVGERFCDHHDFTVEPTFRDETLPNNVPFRPGLIGRFGLFGESIEFEPGVVLNVLNAQVNSLWQSKVNNTILSEAAELGDIELNSISSIEVFFTDVLCRDFPTIIVLKHNILGKVALASKNPNVPAIVTGTYDLLTPDGQHLKPYFKQQILSFIRKYWGGIFSNQNISLSPETQRLFRFFGTPTLIPQYQSLADYAFGDNYDDIVAPQTNFNYPGVNRIFLYSNINFTDDQIEAAAIEFLAKKPDYTNYIHYMGSCGMGDITKDPLAVTNHEMRVHHFENLYVCDASIIPTAKDIEWFNPDSNQTEKTDIIMSPFGHPSAWCYMFGQKLSQELLALYF